MEEKELMEIDPYYDGFRDMKFEIKKSLAPYEEEYKKYKLLKEKEKEKEMSNYINGTILTGAGAGATSAAWTGSTLQVNPQTQTLKIEEKKKYVHLYSVLAIYVGPKDVKNRIVYFNEHTSLINDNQYDFDRQKVTIEESANLLKSLELFNNKNSLDAGIEHLKISINKRETHEVIE